MLVVIKAIGLAERRSGTTLDLIGCVRIVEMLDQAPQLFQHCVGGTLGARAVRHVELRAPVLPPRYVDVAEPARLAGFELSETSMRQNCRLQRKLGRREFLDAFLDWWGAPFVIVDRCCSVRQDIDAIRACRKLE